MVHPALDPAAGTMEGGEGGGGGTRGNARIGFENGSADVEM